MFTALLKTPHECAVGNFRVRQLLAGRCRGLQESVTHFKTAYFDLHGRGHSSAIHCQTGTRVSQDSKRLQRFEWEEPGAGAALVKRRSIPFRIAQEHVADLGQRRPTIRSTTEL